MKRVYLETTIPSYLTAHPSRDLIVAAHQQMTREWWETRRSGFELVVSQVVIEEASGGDSEAAARRLKAIQDLPLLALTDAATGLAGSLVDRGAVPKERLADAIHIAVAAVHGVDYLLTWNMAHIANAELRPLIETVCREAGFEPPVLCTPAELMGDQDVA